MMTMAMLLLYTKPGRITNKKNDNNDDDDDDDEEEEEVKNYEKEMKTRERMAINMWISEYLYIHVFYFV